MEFAILLIEDDPRARETLLSFVERLEHRMRLVKEPDLHSGACSVDLVIAGITRWSEKERVFLAERIERAKKHSPWAQVILCVPPGIEELDKVSLELGARSLLMKPLDIENFKTLLDKTLEQIRKRRSRESYAKKAKPSAHLTDIVGRSREMEEVLALVDKVSKSRDTSVLLLGESGTGKSLFAQAIHDTSERSSGPFMEINCATLPANLLESELFGYEPGAFTDAKKEKVGLIELADGGTLFLDEISEMDVLIQAKLLKFLDTKRIRRLGGGKDIRVDVRVLAATNGDLRQEVARKNFREDLFYRLNVVAVTIPPLRERRGDILHIASYYLDEFRKKFNKPRIFFSEEAVALLVEYDWPGNVRELINIIERAVLLCNRDRIEADDLPLPRGRAPYKMTIGGSNKNFTIELPPDGVDLEELEKKVIEETLRMTGGNVLRASRMLGIKRGALRYKLAKYGIDPRFSRKKQVPVA